MELTVNAGRAEVAQVDALDEDAVEEHARSVAEQAGGINAAVEELLEHRVDRENHYQ